MTEVEAREVLSLGLYHPVEAAFQWFFNITARWVVIYPQLQVKDMSVLYRAPKIHQSVGALEVL